MDKPIAELKLYMLLLGSKAPGRHVEQHDYFFGIATDLRELVPQIKAFWRRAAANIHIDGWREVKHVDGYAIKVILQENANSGVPEKLFFINLGGYQQGKLEEQHYVVLTVKSDHALAIQEAKKTAFFKHNSIASVKDANSHIDDKYGIDIDDIYQISEMLTPGQKAKYYIEITPAANLPEDKIHLGYFRLDKL